MIKTPPQIFKLPTPAARVGRIGKLEDTDNLKPGSRIDKAWKQMAPTGFGMVQKRENADWLFTPTATVKRFGLRAIEFGNWVNQEDRANFLYATAATLDDIAKTYKVKPEGVGLGGDLQLSFGARGNGGSAAAFFVPHTYYLINLTLTRGYGVFIHEFGHAIDQHLYQLEHLRSGKKKYNLGGFMSGGEGGNGTTTRKTLAPQPEGSTFATMAEIFNRVLFNPDGSDSSYMTWLIKTESSYYNERAEIWARIIERHFLLKFEAHGIKNKFGVQSGSDLPAPELVKRCEKLIDSLLLFAFTKAFKSEKIENRRVAPVVPVAVPVATPTPPVAKPVPVPVPPVRAAPVMASLCITFEDIREVKKIMKEADDLKEGISNLYTGLENKKKALEHLENKIDNNVKMIALTLSVTYNTVIDMCYDFDFAKKVLIEKYGSINCSKPKPMPPVPVAVQPVRVAPVPVATPEKSPMQQLIAESENFKKTLVPPAASVWGLVVMNAMRGKNNWALAKLCLKWLKEGSKDDLKAILSEIGNNDSSIFMALDAANTSPIKQKNDDVLKQITDFKNQWATPPVPVAVPVAVPVSTFSPGIKIGFHIRNLFVKFSDLEAISPDKKAKILDLKKEFDNSGYMSAESLGPDQLRRESDRQRVKREKITLRAFRIQEEIYELLKTDDQLKKEAAAAAAAQNKSRIVQLERAKEDLESVYNHKLSSPRHNSTKDYYLETIQELARLKGQPIPTSFKIEAKVKEKTSFFPVDTPPVPVAVPVAVPAAQKTKSSGASAAKPVLHNSNHVHDVRLTDILTNHDYFQNRKDKENKESADKIMNAVANGEFFWATLDPILLYLAPQNIPGLIPNRLYILSGHGRTTAFKRLAAQNIKVEGRGFDRIPAKIIENITLAQAKKIARNSNTLGRKESDTERAEYYRDLRAENVSKAKIKEEATAAEGKNNALILSLSYLKPHGLTLDAYKLFEHNPATSTDIKKIAAWIGQLRETFPQLSDLHEDEIFRFLKDNLNLFKNFVELKAKVEKVVMAFDFNPTNALNLQKKIYKNAFEQSYDSERSELVKAIERLQADQERLNESYVTKSASTDDTQKRAELNKIYEEKLDTINKQLIVARKKLIDFETSNRPNMRPAELFGINRNIKSLQFF